MRKGFDQKKLGFDLTEIGKPGQYFLPELNKPAF